MKAFICVYVTENLTNKFVATLISLNLFINLERRSNRVVRLRRRGFR